MKLKLIIAIVFLSSFVLWQNNDIEITEHIYVSSKLPEGFDGYKIVQISDLHNKNYYGRLSKKIERIKPDIVVITGDLIDRRNAKIDTALQLVEQISNIAPVYYVSGNHEQLSGKYDILKGKLGKPNVKIIDNSYVVLERNESRIGLMGLADPTIQQKESTYLLADSSYYVENNLNRLFENADTNFNILLSHRPEYFHIYAKVGIDLVFSGHAHGGQIRIPFIGGLVAPNQGFFPKYTDGIHRAGSTSMVVSRGLGNSVLPPRIFNRPELVTVILRKQS